MDFSRVISNQQTLKFLDIVVGTCKDHSVECYFGKGKRVLYKGMICQGYFVDSPSARYAVATGRLLEEWLPIAVHEYAHLLQWTEGAPAWKNQVFPEGDYALDRLVLWCDGKVEYSPATLARLVNVAREVERDCEERVSRLIKKFALPINAREHAQKANSYIYYYSAIAIFRRLSVRSPYEANEVWEMMPKRILPTAAYEKIPKKYLSALLREVF